MSIPIPNPVYGMTNPTSSMPNYPVVIDRDPTTRDLFAIATLWCNTTSKEYFILTGYTNGLPVWTAQSGGSETFTDITITGGTGTVFTVQPTGNTLLGGELTVNGEANFDSNVNSGGFGGFTNGVVVPSISGLVAAGDISLEPAIASTSSTAPTLNHRVGSITITGQTIIQGAVSIITINNSTVTTTSSIFLSCSTLDVSGNHAFLAVDGIRKATGLMYVHLTNNSAFDIVPGDDITITFWVIN